MSQSYQFWVAAVIFALLMWLCESTAQIWSELPLKRLRWLKFSTSYTKKKCKSKFYFLYLCESTWRSKFTAHIYCTHGLSVLCSFLLVLCRAVFVCVCVCWWVTPPGLCITGPCWRWWLLLLPWQQRSSTVSGRAEGEWDAPSSSLHPESDNGVLDKKTPPRPAAQHSPPDRLNEPVCVFRVCVVWMRPLRAISSHFIIWPPSVSSLRTGLGAGWAAGLPLYPSGEKISQDCSYFERFGLRHEAPVCCRCKKGCTWFLLHGLLDKTSVAKQSKAL